MAVDVPEEQNLDQIDDKEEEDEDEELDELELRQIPDEGPVNDAMTEVKHKLEIS